MLRPRSPAIIDRPAEQLDVARQVLRSEAAALAGLADTLGEGFTDAVRLLFEAEGDVLTTGIGKAGLIARKAAATLASTGTKAQFLHPSEAVHGDLGSVGAGDVVVAFSNSGASDEVNRLVDPIHELGAAVVAVTGAAGGELARRADAAVVYGRVTEACPIGLAPSTSCAVMMGVGDALAFVLLKMRDFGPEDFGRYHPAGTLGRRFRPIAEVMRSGEQLRIASQDATVRAVFAASRRDQRRTGAVMLTGHDGRLTGLFTDSDLARLLERDHLAALDEPIAGHMTRAPLTLHDGARIADALELFADRHISEIPVLDEAGRPVGLVDVTDVMQWMPRAA